MRGCDRAANLAVVLAIVLVAWMVPVAAAVGTIDYARTRAEADRARTELHLVSAVLLDDPRSADTADDALLAPARWDLDDREYTGEVPTPPGVRTGDTLSLWVDAHGRPVAAPPPGSVIALDAVATAVTVWLAAAVIVGGGVFGLRHLAARHRMRAWDREWEAFDHPDHSSG